MEQTAGENISYGQDDAKGVIIQLLIDDGNAGRGHRKNITSTKFKKHGCFTGNHAKFNHSTCLLYNGSWGKNAGGGGGGGAPMPKFDMKAFMAEPVDWENPPGVKSWSESTKVQMKGNKVIKIVTRTYKMKDGSTQVKEKEIIRDLSEPSEPAEKPNPIKKLSPKLVKDDVEKKINLPEGRKSPL